MMRTQEGTVIGVMEVSKEDFLTRIKRVIGIPSNYDMSPKDCGDIVSEELVELILEDSEYINPAPTTVAGYDGLMKALDERDASILEHITQILIVNPTCNCEVGQSCHICNPLTQNERRKYLHEITELITSRPPQSILEQVLRS